jgi:hypothetical protein
MALFEQDRDSRLRGRADAACGAGDEDDFLRHDFLLYLTNKMNIPVSKEFRSYCQGGEFCEQTGAGTFTKLTSTKPD